MDILVIPSAKVIIEELRNKFGEIPSVLIPLEGRPIIDHLLEKYKEHVDKIYIVGYERKDMIQDYIQSKKIEAYVELIALDELKDLGYSIYYAISEIPNNEEGIKNLTINFGDTIVDEEIRKNENSFYYSQTRQSKRWTTFKYENGKIINIYDKEEVEYEKKYNSFIGVFNINDISSFMELLENSIKDKTDRIDSFFNTILEYNRLYDFEIINTRRWLDTGHLDRYYETAKEVKSRYFNSIEIDKQRGILTKESSNKEKFIKEIEWYLKLPSDIQYLAPRIFDYSLNYNKPYVKMEYYSYNTLHDLFLYGNYSISQWNKIFNVLFDVIDDMGKYIVKSRPEELTEALRSMYIEKTINRLKSLKDSNNFGDLFTDKIQINDKDYHSLSYYISILPSLLNKYDIFNVDYFQIIHGDLCLTNILYSIDTNTVRLVDPRGEFGKFDIYGDVRYDLAKLFHSIQGKYDFIIKDLMDIKINNNKIHYTIHYRRRHEQIEEIFKERLSNSDYNIESTRLIEALLFLSMVPLHKDYPKRQYVMLSKGIELIDGLTKGDIG